MADGNIHLTRQHELVRVGLLGGALALLQGDLSAFALWVLPVAVAVAVLWISPQSWAPHSIEAYIGTMLLADLILIQVLILWQRRCLARRRAGSALEPARPGRGFARYAVLGVVFVFAFHILALVFGVIFGFAVAFAESGLESAPRVVTDATDLLITWASGTCAVMVLVPFAPMLAARSIGQPAAFTHTRTRMREHLGAGIRTAVILTLPHLAVLIVANFGLHVLLGDGPVASFASLLLIALSYVATAGALGAANCVAYRDIVYDRLAATATVFD